MEPESSTGSGYRKRYSQKNAGLHELHPLWPNHESVVTARRAQEWPEGSGMPLWTVEGNMVARALILLLFLARPGWAQEQYYGTRAGTISISGTNDPALLSLIPLRTGDVLTP